MLPDWIEMEIFDNLLEQSFPINEARSHRQAGACKDRGILVEFARVFADKLYVGGKMASALMA